MSCGVRSWGHVDLEELTTSGMVRQEQVNIKTLDDLFSLEKEQQTHGCHHELPVVSFGQRPFKKLQGFSKWKNGWARAHAKLPQFVAFFFINFQYVANHKPFIKFHKNFHGRWKSPSTPSSGMIFSKFGKVPYIIFESNLAFHRAILDSHPQPFPRYFFERLPGSTLSRFRDAVEWGRAFKVSTIGEATQLELLKKLKLPRCKLTYLLKIDAWKLEDEIFCWNGPFFRWHVNFSGE